MTTPAHIEARMLAPELRRRPLVEVLVALHTFETSARIMRRLVESPLMEGVLCPEFEAECLKQIEVLERAAALPG